MQIRTSFFGRLLWSATVRMAGGRRIARTCLQLCISNIRVAQAIAVKYKRVRNWCQSMHQTLSLHQLPSADGTVLLLSLPFFGSLMMKNMHDELGSTLDLFDRLFSILLLLVLL